MRSLLSSFFVFISCHTFACECPALSPISKEFCNGYDVIFYGAVDSVSKCDNKGFSFAFFTIKELYKGNAEKKIKVKFDCSSECLMSFEKGEEWIIYSKYEKFDLLKVVICEHSRKNFSDGTQDIYLIAAHRTFEEEKIFLKTSFGLQKFILGNDLNKQQDQIGPHNEQPSNWGKLTLLVVSLLAMGLVYYFTREK